MFFARVLVSPLEMLRTEPMLSELQLAGVLVVVLVVQGAPVG